MAFTTKYWYLVFFAQFSHFLFSGIREFLIYLTLVLIFV
jgi:hypothetical protein